MFIGKQRQVGRFLTETVYSSYLIKQTNYRSKGNTRMQHVAAHGSQCSTMDQCLRAVHSTPPFNAAPWINVYELCILHPPSMQHHGLMFTSCAFYTPLQCSTMDQCLQAVHSSLPFNEYTCTV